MVIRDVTLQKIEPLEACEIADKAVSLLPNNANRRVLLIISDFTRPFSFAEGIIFNEMTKKYGKGNIDIAVANGMHRASTLSEIRYKLCNGLTESVIYQNNPCNPDWLEDLIKENMYYVICMSEPLPHMHLQMSGGTKLVLPGLSCVGDVERFHKVDGWSAKISSAQACEGIINFYIGIEYDADREVISTCFTKSLGTFDDWKTRNMEHYTVKIPTDLPDAVMLYPKIKKADFQQSMNSLKVMEKKRVVKRGGDICIVSDCPDGIGVHYLFQQGNGISPVYYDNMFLNLGWDNIHFCIPCVSDIAIRKYFKHQRPINFLRPFDFIDYVKAVHGENAKIDNYTAPDIMIGE